MGLTKIKCDTVPFTLLYDEDDDALYVGVKDSMSAYDISEYDFYDVLDNYEIIADEATVDGEEIDVLSATQFGLVLEKLRLGAQPFFDDVNDAWFMYSYDEFDCDESMCWKDKP